MKKFIFLIWPALFGIVIALLIIQFKQLSVVPKSIQINKIDLTTLTPNRLKKLEQTSYIESYADAVEKAAPAVVNIYIRSNEDAAANSDQSLPSLSRPSQHCYSTLRRLEGWGYCVSHR